MKSASQQSQGIGADVLPAGVSAGDYLKVTMSEISQEELSTTPWNVRSHDTDRGFYPS